MQVSINTCQKLILFIKLDEKSCLFEKKSTTINGFLATQSGEICWILVFYFSGLLTTLQVAILTEPWIIKENPNPHLN